MAASDQEVPQSSLKHGSESTDTPSRHNKRRSKRISLLSLEKPSEPSNLENLSTKSGEVSLGEISHKVPPVSQSTPVRHIAKDNSETSISNKKNQNNGTLNDEIDSKSDQEGDKELENGSAERVNIESAEEVNQVLEEESEEEHIQESGLFHADHEDDEEEESSISNDRKYKPNNEFDPNDGFDTIESQSSGSSAPQSIGFHAMNSGVSSNNEKDTARVSANEQRIDDSKSPEPEREERQVQGGRIWKSKRTKNELERDDDEAKEFTEKIAGKRFSLDEDFVLLTYVFYFMKNNQYAESAIFYNNMINAAFYKHTGIKRTGESMRSRFRKQIRPLIEQYLENRLPEKMLKYRPIFDANKDILRKHYTKVKYVRRERVSPENYGKAETLGAGIYEELCDGLDAKVADVLESIGRPIEDDNSSSDMSEEQEEKQEEEQEQEEYFEELNPGQQTMEDLDLWNAEPRGKLEAMISEQRRANAASRKRKSVSVSESSHSEEDSKSYSRSDEAVVINGGEPSREVSFPDSQEIEIDDSESFEEARTVFLMHQSRIIPVPEDDVYRNPGIFTLSDLDINELEY